MTILFIGSCNWRWIALAALLCAVDVRSDLAAATSCVDSAAPIGHLGISRVKGDLDVFVDSAGDRVTVRFLAEPRVQRIDPSGPAQGVLREGDAIVAVNGELITTERAAEAFVHPPVGTEIELRVRRQGKERRISLVPVWICPDNPRSLTFEWREPPAPPAPPDEPSPPSSGDLPAPPLPGLPSAPEPPMPPEPPPLPAPGLPHVWLGMGLRCSLEGREGEGTLRFTEPPVVFRVQKGSAADRAGIRNGDKITHIDGFRIDTTEGTLRFEAIRPGDQVSWTVMRDRTTRELTMTADMMPAPVPPAAEPIPAPPPGSPVEQLRYSGVIASTSVEVHSIGPVSVQVDESNGQMVIRTAEATIRLWSTGSRSKQGIR